MSKIVEVSHDAVLKRYCELSVTLRQRPHTGAHTIVGFVDDRGQCFRFCPETTCASDGGFEALINILSRVYAPRVIYAVHH